MANCPHCEKPIEGFVTRESLKEQVETVRTAKDTEIRQLKDAVVDLRTKATAYDTVLSERDTYRTELEGLKEGTARREALSEAGLSADLADHVGILYTASQAGVAEEERKPFADWLTESGKEHPLLAPHFQQPPAAGQPPSAQPSRPPAPNLNAGAHGAPPPKFITAAQIQAYFASPAYRALPVDQQQAKMAELEAQAQAAETTRFP